MNRIKSGDKVFVIKGKDKGKEGVVSKVLKKNNCKGEGKLYVLIEGINLIKKHVKPNPNKNIDGGIVSKEAPISYSNIAIINPFTGKKDRILFKFLDNGKKVRCFKSNGEVLK